MKDFEDIFEEDDEVRMFNFELDEKKSKEENAKARASAYARWLLCDWAGGPLFTRPSTWPL